MAIYATKAIVVLKCEAWERAVTSIRRDVTICMYTRFQSLQSSSIIYGVCVCVCVCMRACVCAHTTIATACECVFVILGPAQIIEIK